MFNKILIANRGEIACRVAATCRRLGVATVAVYSDADADAKHVAACDEAILIGPAPATESYLLGEKILAAAKATGAQAIHPGYGFLSENAAFAQACFEAGVVFIGPPAGAISAMGSKAAAKSMMAQAGVPLVPGYHGDDQSPALLKREADAIGYPVLLKASAGGGGKGMRVVERSADFAAALASCQREARASFGDDRVLIEKYLIRPRHVEIQVFADTHGEAVYLFERDCSVQRRHQKVLEEAPAPGLSTARREAMGGAAVAAARAVGYVGAGTVEFIVADDAFYFMEMNTRLQVEHPVTEMITGLDLVEWQLRVADGERLPLAQEQLRLCGHAIEARIYAENPARGFLPSTGRLAYLRTPAAIEFSVGAVITPAHGRATAPADQGAHSRTTRIDSGVREGDAISPYYDPMIAKLIVHGRDRTDALAAMRAALHSFEVVGLSTNIAFLQRLIASEPFATADLDTGLIERHHAELFPAEAPTPALALAFAVAALLSTEMAVAATASATTPWTGLGGWRLNAPYQREFPLSTLSEGDAEARPCIATLIRNANTSSLRIGGETLPFSFRREPDDAHALNVSFGHTQTRARAFIAAEVVHVFLHGIEYRLEWRDLLAHAGDTDHGEGSLTAPMPGKVVAIFADKGQRVDKGAPLLVIEAMKMEHTIVAPAAGIVDEVLFGIGDQVTDGAQLLRFVDPEAKARPAPASA
ncbi:acetyl/propionyl/methylcrotonyl-CoA carboxylase subunit alpha [Pararobbsia alpina]|uniref:Acetyl-/propionyl-coenzyme A carboxylase alpha chain n=1 Tax=Pararobbsia alpina TaxID=621374 RepID=A0A6S7BCG4_9BURK|nr:acetyl/propionyl/methylcrotonyl-CoA carboxylase subunit alpha [Pararobbsia alpina]CAB3785039.1 Acetyl-/propionyl-coenzyme A carboxylase alpha chain [Pararobbsia alpina]